jgi:hypothetical protein
MFRNLTNSSRSTLFGLAALVAAGAMPAASFAGHHHHHHHGHHHHGHHHGHHHHGHIHVYRPVVPTYVYRPVVPTYSSGCTSTVAAAAQVATNTIPYQGVGLVLINPSDNSAGVSFNVDNQPVTLQPGQQITLTTKPSFTIAFNRGPGLGNTSYQINDGKIYSFTAGNGTGWELFEQTAAARAAAAANASLPQNAALTQSVARQNAQPVDATEEAPLSLAKRAFEPLAKGDTIVVATESAEVRNGRDVMTTMGKGQQLKVLAVKGAWVMVDVGLDENGWMNRRDVRKSADDGDAPLAITKTR